LRRSRATSTSRAPLRPLAVAVSVLLVAGTPVSAWADWPQFQGDAAHDGISDGPVAPLAVAWRQRDISLESDDAVTGLSSPAVAPDGTIVVVAPGAVKTFDPEDGTELLSVDRDLGPANQPAIADGPDGPIVVFTEGFGNEGPSATGTPGPSPSPTGDEEAFDAHVRAISLDTGEDVWATPVQLEDIVQTPVAVDGSTAYVGDVGGRLTAIDVATGDVRWTAEVGSVIAGAITVADGRALATAFGGQDEASEVVAFDGSTGEEAWRASVEEASNLVSTPVLADGRILVLDALGGVLAFDAADGRSLWRTEVINPIAPSGQPFLLQGVGAPAPVSAHGRVFAVDVTGRAYAFDAETGATLWDHALNDPSRFTPPLLADGQLLVTTDSGTLFAIDTATGDLRWMVDGGADFLRGLADAGDRLVAATGLEDAGLIAFEPDPDGTLLDEPSPTTPDVGELLVGFLFGGLLLGAAIVLLVRPLQRRLAPSSPVLDGPDPSEEHA
jgi:outer membrane protein assembly factor BamB